MNTKADVLQIHIGNLWECALPLGVERIKELVAKEVNLELAIIK
jgi:hypothetical protein